MCEWAYILVAFLIGAVVDRVSATLERRPVQETPRWASVLGVVLRSYIFSGLGLAIGSFQQHDPLLLLSGRFLWLVLGFLMLLRLANPLLLVVLIPLRYLAAIAMPNRDRDAFFFVAVIAVSSIVAVSASIYSLIAAVQTAGIAFGWHDGQLTGIDVAGTLAGLIWTVLTIRALWSLPSELRQL